MTTPDEAGTKVIARDNASRSSSRDEEMGILTPVENNQLKKSLKNRHLQMIAMGMSPAFGRWYCSNNTVLFQVVRLALVSSLGLGQR